MDDIPLHRKFGYQHMVEMAEIREVMEAKGLKGAELHFACAAQYIENHKDDQSYRERQAQWISSPPTPSPIDILREALEQIRDGHNDPRTLARQALESVR